MNKKEKAYIDEAVAAIRRLLLAREAVQAAVAEEISAEEALKDLDWVWDEMDPVAVPDGTGHHWLVEWSGGRRLEIENTREIVLALGED